MAIGRSKKHQNVKNGGDTEPVYPRQTTVIRVNYFSEVRQKSKDTLKNPSPFTGRPSYKDFKSQPGRAALVLLSTAKVAMGKPSRS
jgi:hypothetical protein